MGLNISMEKAVVIGVDPASGPDKTVFSVGDTKGLVVGNITFAPSGGNPNTFIGAGSLTAHGVVGMKPKEEHKVALNSQSEEEMLTDELVTLQIQLDSVDVTAINKRQTELKKELQSIAEVKGFDPMLPVTFKGSLGQVDFSKCSDKTEIELPADLWKELAAKFGMEATFSAVTWNLTQLKKLLSENELAKYTKKGIGSRSAKIKIYKD